MSKANLDKLVSMLNTDANVRGEYAKTVGNSDEDVVAFGKQKGLDFTTADVENLRKEALVKTASLSGSDLAAASGPISAAIVPIVISLL